MVHAAKALRLKLVPIRVGMILAMQSNTFPIVPCPHTRGDDPCIYNKYFMQWALSPYAWG